MLSWCRQGRPGSQVVAQLSGQNNVIKYCLGGGVSCGGHGTQGLGGGITAVGGGDLGGSFTSSPGLGRLRHGLLPLGMCLGSSAFGLRSDLGHGFLPLL